MTLLDVEPVEIARLDEISRDEWLELRMNGLGGSDAGAIAGVNPWTPPLKVWAEKRRLIPPDPDNESMFWGRELEDVIAEVFARKHPELDVWRDTRMVHHPDRPWMFANPDRRIGEHQVLEVKTADKDMAPEWADGPPMHYQCQFQHYCEVLGLSGGYIVVLLGGNRYREYRLDRDDELIDTLVRMEERFWTYNVAGDVKPRTVGTPAEADLIRDMYPGDDTRPKMFLDDDTVAKVDQLVELKESIDLLDDDRRLLEADIKLALGNFTEGIDPASDETVVTWRPHEQNELDTKGLAARAPHLYRSYTRTAPRRPLKTPKRKAP